MPWPKADIDDQPPELDHRAMMWVDFVSLPESERVRAFQDLNPYEDPPLFGAARLAFLEAHPECGAPNEVVVGLGPGVGPYNAIAVRLATGAKVRVPKSFLGIPVVKLVKAKHGWKSAR